MKKIHYTDYFLEREVGAKMKQKGTLKYYPKDDVLYVMLQAGEEAKSVEIEPGVTAELNKGGELIGIEILDASVYSSFTKGVAKAARVLRCWVGV